jgi:RND family efflux transporter MFP subunit
MCVTMVGCRHADQAGMPTTERPPAMVTVAPAATETVPVYLTEIGKTVAMEVVSIVPQVGGKVTAVRIEDGAFVQKGDLLFEIDPRPFEASLASAKAQLAQARAELDWAQIEFRRVQGLMNTASASQLEYDEKRVAQAVAEA